MAYLGKSLVTPIVSNDLTDVNSGNPSNNHVLVYDSSTSQFVSQSLTTAQLPTSGVVAGSYGNASNIPVFSVNAQGLIDSATTLVVAGINGLFYDANGELRISTDDRGSFTVNLDLNPFDTNDLNEGASNLYYTTARADSDARHAVSATGDLSYDPLTGIFSVSTYTKANFDSDFNQELDEAALGGTGLTYTAGTNTLSITDTGVVAGTYGSASQVPVFTVNAQGQIDSASTVSVAGVSSTAFDSASGVFTINTADGGSFPQPVFSQELTRSSLVGGTGITYTAGTGTIDITNTGVSAGTYGSASQVPVFTVNAQGQIDSAGTVSVAGVSAFAYDSATGQLTINTADGGTFAASIVLDPFSTTNLSEGTNLYYTTARADSDAKNAISVTDAGGDGSLTYSAATGVITYTGPSATETRAHLSAGANLGYNSSTGVFSLDSAIASPLDYINLRPKDPIAYSEGRIFYHNEYKALTVYNDVDSAALQVGFEEWIRVYNNTGSTIVSGTPVYATGASGETITVAPADATTEAKARVIGVATHNILDASTGVITTRGLVSGIDTSALTAGLGIHLGVSGDIVNDAPTYPYFPTDLGFCVVSDSSAGYVYIDIEGHTYEQFRVTGNQHVGGNLTVDGDLTISGTQSVVSQANLAVDTSFIYANSGDTIDSDTFTGTGLDDLSFTGHYKGTTTKTFYVRIDATGTPDTFEWSLDNFSTTEATGVAITGSAQTLSDGISVNFNATTGHTVGDKWEGTAAPVNVDAGFAANRNTGTSGVGYTHMGVFFDVTDEKWKMFKSYDPEPEGTINTGHASYEKATLDANLTGNVTGNLTGNVTGNASTATALATGRTIGMTGDVTWTSASFDGSGNVTGTSTLATVNSNVGTFGSSSALPAITVNGKGLITAVTSTNIDHDALTNFVANEHIDHTSVSVTAGAGLTGGGDISATRTLNVGAGTGITVNADNIAISNTGVSAGTYGSTTSIPVFTINAQGQIDSAGTVAVAGVDSANYNTATGVFTVYTADGGSVSDTITLDPFTTTTLAEGTNLYYTSARADSDAKNALVAGNAITYTAATGTIAVASNSIQADELDVTGNGTPGQFLKSDGDGSFTWDSAGLVTQDRRIYTATSGQTIFNSTYSVGHVDVWLNGVKLIDGTDFTATNGTSVVLTTGATAGDIVNIVAYGAFEIADVYTKGVSDSKYLQISNNLSEITNDATARSNIGAIATVVEDTTPQLGGDLDLNGRNVSGTGSIDITGTITLGAWTFKESSGSLYFIKGGIDLMRLDSSGNLDVAGNVNVNAVI